MKARTIVRFLSTATVLALLSIPLQPAGAADPSPSLGAAWTLRQSPTGFHAVAFGAGKFVALGQDKLATSPDGVTWTERTAPPGGNRWASLAYGQGKFVAVASEDSSAVPENVMTSTDGVTWTLANDGLPPGNFWYSITYANGLFVAGAAAVFSGSQLMTSSDGVSWTRQTVTLGTPGVYISAYGNGSYVAAASPNGMTGVTRLHSSSDTTTWVARQLPSDAPEADLYGITFGGGQFIAVGNNQGILTSPDGITWTNRSQTGDYSLLEIVHADGVFVAFGATNTSSQSVILRSTDGIKWVEQTAPSTLTRNAATYAHGIIISLAADNGTSTDTIMTSGTFGVKATATFVPKTARLTEASKSALVSALRELDPSLTIKATFVVKTDKRISRTSLATRRALAIEKFLAKQSGFKITKRVVTRKVKNLPTTEVHTAAGVFRYK